MNEQQKKQDKVSQEIVAVLAANDCTPNEALDALGIVAAGVFCTAPDVGRSKRIEAMEAFCDTIVQVVEASI